MKKCEVCGVEIDFVTRATCGKMPVQGPVLTIITAKGAVAKGRVVHWGDCAKPELFRKGKP